MSSGSEKSEDEEQSESYAEGVDMESSDDEEEEDEIIERTSFLQAMQQIDRGALPQLLLIQKSSADLADNNHLSSLQVQSLAALIDDDLSNDPTKRETKKAMVKTCSFLIEILREIHQKQKEQYEDIADGMVVIADPLGVGALQRALSVRISALPTSKQFEIDGCNAILDSPDTSEQVLPSTMAKKIKDLLKILKVVNMCISEKVNNEDGSPLSLEGIRESGKGLDGILIMMQENYSVEDCCEAFLPPATADREGATATMSIDDWIDMFASGRDGGNATIEPRQIQHVCLFAGVVRALWDHKHGGGKTSEKVYEEDEGEMYHGWHGSWRMDKDEQSNNDICYGVRLGAILEHAEDQAERMLSGGVEGTKYSAPRAKFHEDMSAKDVTTKDANAPTTPDDVVICRAQHCYVEDDTFEGDSGSVYSSMQWSHDGTIGFSHTGSGWKNREFFGHLYSFDRGEDNDLGRRFRSTELGHEFWSTPSALLCDSKTDTVWIHGDQRIKGYSIDPETERFSTSYIFNIENKPKKSQSPQAKRQKREDTKAEHGFSNMMLLGPNRLAYLDEYFLQEWNLSEANRHDGTVRMCDMGNVEESLAQWPKKDILDLSQNTWMDDTGMAEVTLGVKPDSSKVVNIVTPSYIGYLGRNRLAMTHLDSSQIQIRDHELREVSRLVGFCGEGVGVVQRPTFEGAGDENIFVASDLTCAKIFDLRSGKVAMTIKQSCITSTPIYCGGAKFVLNKLRAGRGAMMWDLRAQKALYSLPIGTNTEVAWVPTSADDQSLPPILLTGSGEAYKFGVDWPQDDDWEMKSAKRAWAEIEKQAH